MTSLGKFRQWSKKKSTFRGIEDNDDDEYEPPPGSQEIGGPLTYHRMMSLRQIRSPPLEINAKKIKAQIFHDRIKKYEKKTSNYRTRICLQIEHGETTNPHLPPLSQRSVSMSNSAFMVVTVLFLCYGPILLGLF